MGKGLVLTVAHVIGSVARTKPNVRIADMDLPARAIREGNVENVDLTLLSIDEQKLPIYLQMRRMPLVKGPHGRASLSLSRFPKKRRARMSCHRCHFLFQVPRKFSTLIKEVGTTENSGSGVFDAGNNVCSAS